jgi:hypothetical protein
MLIRDLDMASTLVNSGFQPNFLSFCELKQTTGTSAFHPLRPPVYSNFINDLSSPSVLTASLAI